MKKLILLFTLVFIVFNCSDDDDNDGGINDNVNDRLTIAFDIGAIRVVEGTSDDDVTLVDVILNISGGQIFEDQFIDIIVGGNSTVQESDFIVNGLENIVIPQGNYTVSQSIAIPISIVQDSQIETDETIELILDDPENIFNIQFLNVIRIIIEDDEFNILGARYDLTNYILETPSDTNNNGTFSNDVLFEINVNSVCNASLLIFNSQNGTNRVLNPKANTIRLTITNNNGNLIQDRPCGSPAISNSFTSFEQVENIINFINISSDEILFTGELSDDGSIITIDIPNELLVGVNPDLGFFAGNEILREDGTIEEYTGGATVIYRRVQ